MHCHTACNRVHAQEPCVPTHFIILIFTAHPSYADVITWPTIPANLPELKDHGLLSLRTFSTCFCTCRAPLHMPLRHTPHYPTPSIESQIQTAWPLIIRVPLLSTLLVISSTVEASCRSGSCLWHLPLSHPEPRDTRQPDDREQFSGVSPWEQSWGTTQRPYGFVHDKFALDRLHWHWGNESRAVYRDPSIRASLFSSGTRPGLCQNIPMRSLSDVLNSRPVRGFKSLSWVRETDGSSICLDKRWETIGLIVNDRNPSRVSVTLFSDDVLELGQHWEKIVASCVVCRWPTLALKVRAERKLIHSRHWWDVPRAFCGRRIREMSAVVRTQLTPWPFAKKLKRFSLYSASHRMVIQSRTTSCFCSIRYSTHEGAYCCGMWSTWVCVP